MITNLNDDWMDSTLWLEEWSTSRPALMTIKIRVFLQKEASQTLTWTDSNNQIQTTQTINWDAASWGAWRRDLTRVVNAGWSDKIWLEPMSQWVTGRNGSLINNPVAPSIRLRLRIDCDVPRKAAHVIVRSYRLPAPAPGQTAAFARSSMQAPFNERARRCSLQGNDTFGYLDTNDLLAKATGQIPAIHEFGHYIGLSHVNAANTPTNTNAPFAYGKLGSYTNLH